jgi:hypothetical protein
MHFTTVCPHSQNHKYYLCTLLFRNFESCVSMIILSLFPVCAQCCCVHSLVCLSQDHSSQNVPAQVHTAGIRDELHPSAVLLLCRSVWAVASRRSGEVLPIVLVFHLILFIPSLYSCADIYGITIRPHLHRIGMNRVCNDSGIVCCCISFTMFTYVLRHFL